MKKNKVQALSRSNSDSIIVSLFVLDDMANGVSNAFSEFVHAETVRNFKDVPMLVLPAIENA